ncbi:hypothetical protein VQ056_23050 [Paenibacillus sp. JTLBN-2024]
MNNKRHRLSISFRHEYQHVFEHLGSISNKSDYVAKAVEAYMVGKKTAASYEEIKTIVMEVLRENETLPLLNSSSQTDLLSDEDAELINELF